jgi:diguanylate cyclase (GGDEF)-like protein
MRATDVIGRIGGEEFAAILPSGAAEAAMVAERVRAAFQVAAIEISGHAAGATVSTGLACALPPVEIEALLARADAALYRAKGNGRNRVEIADEEPAPAAATPPRAADAQLPDMAEAAVALR